MPVRAGEAAGEAGDIRESGPLARARRAGEGRNVPSWGRAVNRYHPFVLRALRVYRDIAGTVDPRATAVVSSGHALFLRGAGARNGRAARKRGFTTRGFMDRIASAQERLTTAVVRLEAVADTVEALRAQIARAREDAALSRQRQLELGRRLDAAIAELRAILGS